MVWVPDSRKRRLRRLRLAGILLAGAGNHCDRARSFAAIKEWATDASSRASTPPAG